MSSRQLHLGAFMRPVSIHTGAWRYPGAFPDANFNLAHLKRFAQTLERGKFDAFFMADHLAVLNMPVEALKRSHTVTSFEPFTLLSALAAVTERIGLVATASTTFDAALPHRPPVRLARPHQRRARGLEHRHHLQPGRGAELRPRRAHGARRSLRPRARILRRRHRPVGQLGRRRLRARCRERHLRRPRQAARARPQGQILVGARAAQHRAARPGLAGDRAGRCLRAGRQLAAETAEVVFAAGSNLAGRSGSTRTSRAAPRRPGATRTTSRSCPVRWWSSATAVDEARAKRARLDSLVHYDNAIASLSIALGHDASGFDPDGPLPEIPETNASKSGRERVVELASARTSLCASSPSASAATAGSPSSARPPASPTPWRNGSPHAAATASTSCSRTCPKVSTTSWIASCRSCSGAACSGANTPGPRCARPSVCRVRTTASFPRRASEARSKPSQATAG